MTNKEIRTYDDMVEEILYLRRTLERLVAWNDYMGSFDAPCWDEANRAIAPSRAKERT